MFLIWMRVSDETVYDGSNVFEYLGLIRGREFVVGCVAERYPREVRDGVRGKGSWKKMSATRLGYEMMPSKGSDDCSFCG